MAAHSSQLKFSQIHRSLKNQSSNPQISQLLSQLKNPGSNLIEKRHRNEGIFKNVIIFQNFKTPSNLAGILITDMSGIPDLRLMSAMPIGCYSNPNINKIYFA